MKKLISFLATLVVALTFASVPSSASADDFCGGINVQYAYSYCEYYEWPSTEPQQRLCQNGDTLVIVALLTPGCPHETGVLTVTAMNREANNVSWLQRPRFVRFQGLAGRYVKVRLKGIHLWTDDPADVDQFVHVQVTPVSSENAIIVDDYVFQAPWLARFVDWSDGGKG